MGWTSPIAPYVRMETRKVLAEAEAHADTTIEAAKKATREYLARTKSVATADTCVVLLGSFGRREGMGASDLDLVPVTTNKPSDDAHRDLQGLRERLQSELGLDVSKGTDIMGTAVLSELT